jgi:maltooligosyltrehalose trehalohydrolase
MPVAEFAGDHGWGYDGVDLFAPHHAYGGPVGLKRFVDACHTHGLGVIMDVVYNHIGPEGNYLPAFGPYIEEGKGNPWGRGLNLVRAGSTEVRNWVIENAQMWIRDFHCDGLRLDAIHALRWEGAVGISMDIHRAVHEVGASQKRKVLVIAEDDTNDTSVVLAPEAGGLGLDAVYANVFQRALQAVVSGERSGHYRGFGALAQVVEALLGPWVYAGEYAQYADERKQSPRAVDSSRFVVYLQNHDQVGNREQGDRISSLATLGLVKVGAALTLLSPYTPMIFQGEEWASATPFLFFTDRHELQEPGAVLRGRIDEFAGFGWDVDAVPDPQSPTSFTRSQLQWSDLESGEHREMLEWYRRLIALRHERGLGGRRLNQADCLYDESAGWLRVVRGSLVVAANFGHASVVVPMTGAARILLASAAEIAVEGGEFYLPAESVAVAMLNGVDPRLAIQSD